MVKVTQKDIMEAVELFDTSDFSSIYSLCDRARKDKLLVGIAADTGMGKTTALTSYAKRKNVYYVRYEKMMKPRNFFISLLKEMGIDYEGSINDMVNRIIVELNQQESPLVIVDEAGKITHAMILYLHDLRDKTNKKAGIVLAGMPYFKNNLIKFSNKEKEGYSEFFRRINLWHTLNGLTRKEIQLILDAHGISDSETQKQFHYKKRFGDLMNEIYLLKYLNY